MIPILSAAGARAFDAHHVDTSKIPSLVLMENAGRGAAELLLRLRDGLPTGDPRRAASVAVISGAGNNGGDGFVVARHLLAAGDRVVVYFVGDEAQSGADARAHREAFAGLGGTIRSRAPSPAELAEHGSMVDALFGTGLRRRLEGDAAAAVHAIRAASGSSASVLKLALDIPSGIDADTGEVHGVAVRADHTVTFGHRKMGLFTTQGAAHAGELHVASIGVPEALPPGVEPVAQLLEPADVAGWIAPRSLAAHKHAVGQAVLFCGAPGTLGAAWMASEGALRGGAGSVTIASFPAAVDALQSRVVEAMTTRLDPDDLAASIDRALAGKTVALVGPGFGTDDQAVATVERLLGSALPLVLDADALTIVAKKGLASLASRRAPTILTPHAGELGRLLGSSSAAVERDRLAAVTAAQSKGGQVVVVLKGPRTLIAGSARVVVNDHASAALATAGSGDTLAGIITALACTLPAFEAACAGVFVHGETARRWSETHGDRGLLASDVAEGVPETLAHLARSRR